MILLFVKVTTHSCCQGLDGNGMFPCHNALKLAAFMSQLRNSAIINIEMAAAYSCAKSMFTMPRSYVALADHDQHK